MSTPDEAMRVSVSPIREEGAAVVEGEEEEAIGEEDEEEGGANWKKFQDPKLPSSDEQRLHNITHVPYRSWCDHCVKGKAKIVSHTKQEEKERTMP